MRGREVFMHSLEAHGVTAIFGNPGTTENPVLDSLVEHPGINYYVALHEGVAVGAAGFYAQASGKVRAPGHESLEPPPAFLYKWIKPAELE